MSINWTFIRENLLGTENDHSIPHDVKIPVMPKALTEFLQLSKDPDCNFQKLGEIVETDVGLTCELLKSVNSSKYGLRNRVNTVCQALSILGLRNAKLMLISESMKITMSQRESRLMNLQTFWNTNLERAILARKMASKLGHDPELSFSAAIIQDFILPALSNDHTDFYAGFMSRSKTDTTDLVVAEHEYFGWDHAELGARLLLHWDFPDELVVCVLLHHSGLEILTHPHLGKTSVSTVAITGNFPDLLRQSGCGLEKLLALEASLDHFDLRALAQDVEQEFKTFSGIKQGIHTTLHQRLLNNCPNHETVCANS